MKTNLNIAYLNGAEGMIRRGAASSGGSGSGEASTIEYLDVREINNYQKPGLCVASVCLKTEVNNNLVLMPYASFGEGGVSGLTEAASASVAIAIDKQLKYGFKDNILSTYEFIQQISGYTQEQLDAIPRITKEQFYSLE